MAAGAISDIPRDNTPPRNIITSSMNSRKTYLGWQWWCWLSENASRLFFSSFSRLATSSWATPTEHKRLCYWKWYQNPWEQCDRQGYNFLSNGLQLKPENNQYWKSIWEHQATGLLQLQQQLLAIDQQVPSQLGFSGVYQPSGPQERFTIPVDLERERHLLETAL